MVMTEHAWQQACLSLWCMSASVRIAVVQQVYAKKRACAPRVCLYGACALRSTHGCTITSTPPRHRTLFKHRSEHWRLKKCGS
eukprot:15449188-Alexandrium_andersonii.AAC.1